MSVTESQAQSLCSPTEWKTVVNSFPPKLSELGHSAVKKNAKRIARFLSKAEKEGEQEKIHALREALERVRALGHDEDKNDSARRGKEKKAREKRQQQKNQQAQVRERLRQKRGKPEAPAETKPIKKKKSVREQLLGERK